MGMALREVLRSAALWPIWLRLGVQDVQLRFRRSALGVGWIFLNLAIMIVAIGVIYSALFGQDLGVFIPKLTISLVAWGYLTNSIVEGGGAFVNSEGYIKQISLPIYVYVFRAFVSIGLNSLISLLAYALVAALYSVPVTPGLMWALPGMLILMAVSFGLIFVFAHLNVRFRDAAHLAALIMQVMFYVTPVIFPAELLSQRGLGLVVDLNPLYHLLEVLRHPLLAGEPATAQNYLVAGLTALALAGGALALMSRYRRRIVFFL